MRMGGASTASLCSSSRQSLPAPAVSPLFQRLRFSPDHVANHRGGPHTERSDNSEQQLDESDVESVDPAVTDRERFSQGLIYDAADLIVEFLGPNLDALSLSCASSAWASIVRTSEVWIPVITQVAPFSNAPVISVFEASIGAGAMSTRVDWVSYLAVAWRRQLTLQATRSTVALRSQRKGKATVGAVMASWVAAPFRAIASPFMPAAPRRVVVTGTPESGKRTFLSILEQKYGAKLVPTSTWFRMDCPPNWQITVSEVVNTRRIRPLLKPIFNEATAIVAIVNAADTQDLDDFRREMEAWILRESRRVPICVLVTKLDKPGALSTEGVFQRLGLDQAAQSVFGACATMIPHDAPGGRRHMAAIGTCLNHAMVGHNAVSSVMSWLDAATTSPPPDA